MFRIPSFQPFFQTWTHTCILQKLANSSSRGERKQSFEQLGREKGGDAMKSHSLRPPPPPHFLPENFVWVETKRDFQARGRREVMIVNLCARPPFFSHINNTWQKNVIFLSQLLGKWRPRPCPFNNDGFWRRYGPNSNFRPCCILATYDLGFCVILRWGRGGGEGRPCFAPRDVNTGRESPSPVHHFPRKLYFFGGAEWGKVLKRKKSAWVWLESGKSLFFPPKVINGFFSSLEENHTRNPKFWGRKQKKSQFSCMWATMSCGQKCNSFVAAGRYRCKKNDLLKGRKGLSKQYWTSRVLESFFRG